MWMASVKAEPGWSPEGCSVPWNTLHRAFHLSEQSRTATPSSSNRYYCCERAILRTCNLGKVNAEDWWHHRIGASLPHQTSRGAQTTARSDTRDEEYFLRLS